MKTAYFAILMQLLRDRAAFLTEIEQNKRIASKIVALLISSSAFLALYIDLYKCR